MKEAIRQAARELAAKENPAPAEKPAVNPAAGSALEALRAAKTKEQEVEAFRLLVKALRD